MKAENHRVHEVSQQPVPPHDSISQLQLSISHAAVDVPRAARSLYVRAFDSLTETKLKHSDWLNCVFPRAQFLPSTSSSPFQTRFASFSLHFLSSFHFSLWVFLFQFLFFLFFFHQWPCTPLALCTLPAWWCDWCWPWLPWCACCPRWPSPAFLNITWETTPRGKSPPLKTAVTRTTRGILEISMTRLLHFLSSFLFVKKQIVPTSVDTTLDFFFFPASHCVDCSDFSSWIRLKKVLSDTVIAPSRVWVWQPPHPPPQQIW